jgi:hypothetical protein
MNKFAFTLILVALTLHCRADFRDEFNELFQKGKYDLAERLLLEKGPSSNDPATAARILKSLRDFRESDPNKETAFIIHNPTGKKLTYQTRWGSGEWDDTEIDPFGSWRHKSSAARDGTPGSGNPSFRQTQLPAGEEQKTYSFDASVVAKGQWSWVNKYYLAPRTKTVTYCVTGIASDDTLNVRSGPGTEHSIAARLSPGTAEIQITGEKRYNGNDDWVPISFPGGVGWTRPKYLVVSNAPAGPLGLYKFTEYSDYVGALKILNPTRSKVTFKWRWRTSDNWTTQTLEPNAGLIFSHDYYPNVYLSPEFDIEFDHILNDAVYSAKSYRLDRFKAKRDQKDQQAKVYDFKLSLPALPDPDGDDRILDLYAR